MEMVIDNGYALLKGASPETADAINRMTSYMVEGHRFIASFRSGFWDGRIKLLRRTKTGLRFPVGLLADVEQVLRNIGGAQPTVIDKRRPVGKARKLPWLAADIQLRDYQQEAVDLAVSGVRGILKLPIRSGKTVIAAGIIHRLGRPAVFLATSQLILRQTYELFLRIFGGDLVGIIGEGEFAPKMITVASIQRLQRMDPATKRLLAGLDVLIVDEVHHMRGDSWRKPVIKADARYKIGLSATVILSRKLCERSAIWLKSATGPLLMDVPMQRLVDGGYIMSPLILVADLPKPANPVKGTWHDAYDRLIVRNGDRNRLITEATALLVEHGHRVLIDTGRLAHIKYLYSEIRRRGLPTAMIYGAVAARDRAVILDRFKSGAVPVLIGTVMGEGVDVPVLSGVINAEGGASAGSTIQRMRNLTQHPGKQRPILIDFMDSGNKHLRRHSRARIKVYKSESAFELMGPLAVPEFLSEIVSAHGK